jgi:hypothetical protein
MYAFLSTVSTITMYIHTNSRVSTSVHGKQQCSLLWLAVALSIEWPDPYAILRIHLPADAANPMGEHALITITMITSGLRSSLHLCHVIHSSSRRSVQLYEQYLSRAARGVFRSRRWRGCISWDRAGAESDSRPDLVSVFSPSHTTTNTTAVAVVANDKDCLCHVCLCYR